jgi:hypothetical protein
MKLGGFAHQKLRVDRSMAAGEDAPLVRFTAKATVSSVKEHGRFAERRRSDLSRRRARGNGRRCLGAQQAEPLIEKYGDPGAAATGQRRARRTASRARETMRLG